MRSLLPPAAYIDQEWFARERNLFFLPLWQFAGLRTMLNNHNDYITRSLCGVSVLVQNFNGEIRAFQNICLHRQNPLQKEAQGNRPLVCTYHGWRYNANGKPEHIPFEQELYRYPKEERDELQLKSYAVEVIGNLIFINMALKPIPIVEQFSAEFLSGLVEVSNAFDNETILTTFRLKCNWKLVYENLRDAHHPRFVHAQSIYKNVRFDVRLDESAINSAKLTRENKYLDRDTVMKALRGFSNGGLNEPLESLPDYAWHRYVQRFSDKDWYYNWLAFPNLHIASGSGGYSFIIEHHIPISADRTDMIVHYVTARKHKKYATSAAVLYEHMLGGANVLREDIKIMEDIQQVLYSNSPKAYLGDFESANATIEHLYQGVMDGSIRI